MRGAKVRKSRVWTLPFVLRVAQGLLVTQDADQLSELSIEKGNPSPADLERFVASSLVATVEQTTVD